MLLRTALYALAAAATASCGLVDHYVDEIRDRIPDAASFGWTRVETVSPTARLESALVYDRAAGLYILFGGRDDDWNVVGETWQFAPASKTWSQIETTTAPSPRFMHAMTYDRRRGQTILYGGTDGVISLSDLWSFDHGKSEWSKLSADGPPPRMLHGMTYDPERDRLVVFGGRYQTASEFRQLFRHLGVRPRFP